MPDVTMPQLGETVADGTVTKWFKKVGDSVVRGESLFEVSTDKVDTEIPAQVDGILTAILVEEGVTVDVGTTLAVIGVDGAGALSADSPPVVATAVPTTTTQAIAAPTSPAASTSPLSPVVRRLLAEHDLDAHVVHGTGPQGRITRDDVLAHVANAQATAPATAPVGASTSALSPVVRRLLSDHRIDPSAVVATGANGRLTRRDVEAFIERGDNEVATVARGDEVLAFTKRRRLTAEHMVRSKATSAHTLMVREVDFERVEVARRSAGAAFKEREGFTLTYLPFIAVATLQALKEFPHLNASVGNDELIIHHDLNLGVAVDLDSDGLVVPVVHGADEYGLRTLALKIRELAARARTKQLTLDDMANGTFTITNPGPFGTLLTGAIINQPQVAILSTDGIARKPVVVTSSDGEESIAIHSVGMLALTFDHRAIDGAYAARFLLRIADILNTRNWAEDL